MWHFLKKLFFLKWMIFYKYLVLQFLYLLYNKHSGHWDYKDQ